MAYSPVQRKVLISNAVEVEVKGVRRTLFQKQREEERRSAGRSRVSKEFREQSAPQREQSRLNRLRRTQSVLERESTPLQ